MYRRFIVGAACLAAIACTDRDPLGTAWDAAPADPGLVRSANAPGHLTVLTRNMYVGAPVEPILAETDPNAVPIRVAEAWAILLSTDFGTRAQAMAAEIAHLQPQLVGLQEVSLIRTQTPSDVVLGVLEPNATDVAFDFLETLLAELAALGAHYYVASSVENTDVEVPRFDFNSDPIPFTDVRLTDSDVVLARADVPTSNSASANFQQGLPLPNGIEVVRGWTAVDAVVHGVTYRFVNTHLESDVPLVRLAQVGELIALFGGETRPLVVVGDFNSGPGRPETAAYEAMRASGYADVWNVMGGPPSDGFTCCHAGDLSNLDPSLTQRIDLVFFRNVALRPGHAMARARVIGGAVNDRMRFGIWPSDHAGVVATLVRPNAGGLVAD